MPVTRITTQIEDLIRRSQWKQAQSAIKKALDKEPDDHWLWSRLSGVKYERRDYRGALEAAEKALEIVPDCPLAIWSKAIAVEMLGKVKSAMPLYALLIRRGLQQLRNPDADADDCWEGSDWTAGVLADCVFRTAGCRAKLGQSDKAIKRYQVFLGLGDLGMRGIYSREDALESLNKLVPSKEAKREAALKVMKEELIPA